MKLKFNDKLVDIKVSNEREERLVDVIQRQLDNSEKYAQSIKNATLVDYRYSNRFMEIRNYLSVLFFMEMVEDYDHLTDLFYEWREIIVNQARETMNTLKNE